MDFTVTLPGGETLDGTSPIVVIGPNGSGKTRKTRDIAAAVPIEFINALRNTRVAPELQAMGAVTARTNYTNQKSQARSQPWELTSEFDSMLSQLLAQESMTAIEFSRKYSKDKATAGDPEETPLRRVEKLWGQVFPGRELLWVDWKPMVRSTTAGETGVEYSGNGMSDGEKAALFLAGRVFTAEPGILVVDEPETHFHSLLAVKLWNALEDARPDVRFVYVTHDLTFALSRRSPRFVLASPVGGLRAINVDENLPDDVAGALLGSASLSFYASRVIFCEGNDGSLDTDLYDAWFNGEDTVVRGVGGWERVFRCTDAVALSGIATALAAHGIVDGDFHSSAFAAAVPTGISILPVHEVESLFCLPEVVKAVAAHTKQEFGDDDYRVALVATVNADQHQAIIIERWKQQIEPKLTGIVADVKKHHKDVDAVLTALPDVFDHTKWAFSPSDLLTAERALVDAAIPGGSTLDILKFVPGKQLLPVAAKTVGMTPKAYTKLVVDAVRGKDHDLEALGAAITPALSPLLPARQVAPLVPTVVS